MVGRNLLNGRNFSRALEMLDKGLCTYLGEWIYDCKSKNNLS